MLDPFSMAMSGGRAAMGMGGRMGMGMMGRLGMGALGAGAMALPFMAAGAAVDAYGGAFMGGVQQQTGWNQALRQNFQHFGGQGPMGRGFSQQQMGQIGGMLGQQLRADPMLGAQELPGLIAGGAQAGMFTGTRDVSDFAQKFRQMIDTLKQVQRDLGGSLNDALQFVQQSKASGIFQTADRVRFAAGMRETQAVTGMSSDQISQVTQAGAQITRAMGGRGRQGAFGAQRIMQQLGGAVQTGAIREEDLSEATGGLTGADAIQAFTTQMMQMNARASRRGHGRYTTFGLMNEEGTGVDRGMMERFAVGDVGVRELSRSARRNVRRLGRAGAINREGMLSSSIMEEGGLAGQIGRMRQLAGSRFEDAGDDLGSLVLQRRFRMSRPQAEIMMSLMRNQGEIAQEESSTRLAAGRQSALQTDIRENRSVDAFMRNLSHGLQEATGITRVREMGRQFATKTSSMVERFMNDMLGIADNELSASQQRAFNRITSGRATGGDIRMMGQMRDIGQIGRGGSGIPEPDPFAEGLLQSGPSLGTALESMGYNVSGYGTGVQGRVMRRAAERGNLNVGNVRGLQPGGLQVRAGMSQEEQRQAYIESREAQRGIVGDDRQANIEAIAGDPAVRRQMDQAVLNAMSQARAMGRPEAWHEMMSTQGMDARVRTVAGDPRTMRAYAAQRNFGVNPDMVTPGMMANLGVGGHANVGTITRDIGRIALSMTGLGPIDQAIRAAGGEGFLGNLESVEGASPQERATSFLGAGGHLARSLQSENERIESQRGELYDRMMSEGIRPQQRRYMANALVTGQARKIENERTLEEITSVGPEAIDAAIADEGVSSAMRDMFLASRTGDSEGFQIARDRLQSLAVGANTPTMQAAINSIGRQADHSMERWGELGREFGAPSAQEAERLRERLRTHGLDIQQAARDMRNFEIRDEELADTVGGVSQELRAIGQMYATNPSGATKRQENLIERISRMGDRERSAAIGALGESDVSRGLGLAAGRRSAARTALMGRGRRGRRGAEETLMNMLTGGTTQGMEFSIGGRRLGQRDLSRQLTRALSGARGEGAQTEIREQLVSQMQELGISGAENLVGVMEGVLGGEGGRGIVDSEANRVIAAQRNAGGELRRASERQRMAAQQRDDPLGVERNRILQGILSAVNANRPNTPTGEEEDARQSLPRSQSPP
jgi:hypothetical protein